MSCSSDHLGHILQKTETKLVVFTTNTDLVDIFVLWQITLEYKMSTTAIHHAMTIIKIN